MKPITLARRMESTCCDAASSIGTMPSTVPRLLAGQIARGTLVLATICRLEGDATSMCDLRLDIHPFSEPAASAGGLRS